MTQTVRSERGRVGYKSLSHATSASLAKKLTVIRILFIKSEINTNTKKRTGTKQLLTWVIKVEFLPRY